MNTNYIEEFKHGLFDSVSYNIILDKTMKYDVVREKILKCVTFNLTIVVTYLIFNYCSFSINNMMQADSGIYYLAGFLQIVNYVLFITLLLGLFALGLILNNVWRGKILDVIMTRNLEKKRKKDTLNTNTLKTNTLKTNTLKTNENPVELRNRIPVEFKTKTPTSYSPIHHIQQFEHNVFMMIQDNISTLVFYVLNTIILNILPFILLGLIYYCIKGILYFTIGFISTTLTYQLTNVMYFIIYLLVITTIINLKSLVYSSYCLEYKLKSEANVFGKYEFTQIGNRMRYIAQHQYYFIGFSAINIIMSYTFSFIIFTAISEVLFTFGLIISLYCVPYSDPIDPKEIQTNTFARINLEIQEIYESYIELISMISQYIIEVVFKKKAD